MMHEHMELKSVFEGKKITVMGLGLLGRGIGDAAFLAEMGAKVLVTDLKSVDDLKDSVEQLKQYENVEFVLGEHRFQDFEDRDYVLVAAGVPAGSDYLRHAREAGVPLKQSAAWFAELSRVPIIGVTGTRGKSTVTHMIHHVLSEVTGEKILLGGNVRGLSNLQLLKEARVDSLCVMELDSWQLQGFGWAEISPQIAVFTNFMEDHLNYYMKGGRSEGEAMELYFADKANIFKYQDESGTFITTPEVFERARQLPGVTLGQEVILADASVIPEDSLLSMPGEHNRLNAALAYEALRAVSLCDDEIFAGLASFPGVPGRLEYLGEHDGVKIYNDNNSTTPAATIVGLRAVGNKEERNVVLILGGDEKNIDMTELLAELPKWCSKVVLFKERGTDRIKDAVLAMQDDGLVVHEEEGLEATVQRALAVAESGEVVLYSPGFSSFGKYFKNEFDRGDQFVLYVNGILE
jgi:UDP-N-acetylmuramoylalanine--D-glutamate ligase